jgi:hypothetical protein
LWWSALLQQEPWLLLPQVSSAASGFHGLMIQWILCLVEDRFWPNNKSRMYLLEITGILIRWAAQWVGYRLWERHMLESTYAQLLSAIWMLCFAQSECTSWWSMGRLMKLTWICKICGYFCGFSGDFVKAHHLQEGDLLIMYRNVQQGNYVRILLLALQLLCFISVRSINQSIHAISWSLPFHEWSLLTKPLAFILNDFSF